MTLNTHDLLTEEERCKYFEIAAMKRSLSEPLSKETREETVKRKHIAQEELSKLISSHEHVPRKVNLASILDPSLPSLPEAVSWNTLKPAKRIAEFVSEESRAMGLAVNQITFDKIIIKWKSVDILRQIIVNGFSMPVYTENGDIVVKHYRFMTASAGQLRTDKIQVISEDMWEKIEPRIMCGMTWERINTHGGINTSKLLAYMALPSSATDHYDLDIDRCIVIDDFEAPVTGRMDYIKPDYTIDRGLQTVVINHTDGSGMMLPEISRWNFMIRGPWLKGLLCSFDFLRFCSVNHCQPVVKDIWGLEHDLVKENIKVIFTKSQLKLWKYYNSWEEYKKFFKECGCCFGRTNLEEPYIKDSEFNYQFIQALQDFSDEDLKTFAQPTYDRIKTLSTDREHMLHALGADEYSEIPYRQALLLYPELLREAYSKESLKAIKKRWTLDAKSGRIRCKNKRLFAIPDLYAACQFWFLHQAKPEGLLKDGEVYTRIYRDFDELDVLRSPSLYMEHAVRRNVHDADISTWFYTNGIYTSCHDMISRILQFDVDGDQLNVVADPVIIRIAKENIEKYDIIPLFYDATKAPPEQVSIENMFHGVKRAHDYSGIGQISNALTRLWNRPNPDLEAAAYLCYFNNLTIDGAKTGSVNSYEGYPEASAKINSAIGGSRGRMPYFFQFTKNGRHNEPNKKKKPYAKPNKSTMNRLCVLFDDIGNINMNLAGIPPFNGDMFFEDAVGKIDQRAVDVFCELDSSNLQSYIDGVSMMSLIERYNVFGYDAVKELIIEKLVSLCGSLENAYPSVAWYLFKGGGSDKPSHKQMFWRVFGDIAIRNLRRNLMTCITCKKCQTKIPLWQHEHSCSAQARGFYTCIDCGKWCERSNSRQSRCPDCQKEYRRIAVNEKHIAYRAVRRAARQAAKRTKAEGK